MEPTVVLPKLISNESSSLELNAIIFSKCNVNFIFIYVYSLDLFKKDNTPILNYNSILKTSLLSYYGFNGHSTKWTFHLKSLELYL
jgi:hypothetical protein